MNRGKQINNEAFTLLEIILVMFIVASSFTGIYVVLSKVSQHEKDDRYSLIASNLAQEGIEIIRNKRDENLLDEDNMNTDLSTGTCYPYWSGSSPFCDDSKDEKVELDSEDIYRNCDSSGCGSGETIFERECEIIDSDDEVIRVNCTVGWESPTLGIEKEIEIQSYLTNWQEND